MNEGSVRRWRAKIYHSLRLDALAPGVRRAIIGIIGGTILLIGLALIVLPGPAVVVIPLGLAILGSEFGWARRAIRRARELLPGRSGAARRQ